MPQDAFHLSRVAKELNTYLTGGKINRIAQIDKDELYFIIYTGFSTVKLVLSTNASNARVCLSEREKEPLATPPNFCMLLRKHLQGAKILSVTQCGFERILEIRFFCANDFSECERSLYCELMGKYSNLVLVENGVILGALKTTALDDNVKRILFAGAKYAFPAPQEKVSPFSDGFLEFCEKFEEKRSAGESDEDLAFFLFDKVSGFALSTAREVVKRSKGVPVYAFLPRFIQDEPVFACIVKENGKEIDFFAFDVLGGESQPSLNKAEDLFYTGKELKKELDGLRRKAESAVRAQAKKQLKKLTQTQEKLEDAKSADEDKLFGELLTANLYQIRQGQQVVELDNWYDGQKVKIKLDVSLSPAKNAQRYFKSYAKKKRAAEVLGERKLDEERELSYLETLSFWIENAQSKQELEEILDELVLAGLLKEQKKGRKKQEESAFREYSFGGFTIFAGKNNLQNERLLRLLKGEDIWLHTQKHHSAFVAVKSDGKRPTNDVLLFAAEICAYYSSGKNGDKIPVDYCERKFVKKPPKTRTGFVIYSEYKTLLVTPNAHADKQL